MFEDQVIVFSDKSCGFPDTGDLILDWKRWYGRSVERSAKQALGAARHLRTPGAKLFLDEKATQPLPIEAPSSPTIHVIVVAAGSFNRCVAEYPLGSGTLIVSGNAIGDTRPFAVGPVGGGEQFIHVFDDHALEILLKELDTISDFARYLTTREALIRSNGLIVAHGEEDLLAVYQEHVAENGEHGFPTAHGDLVIQEGFWLKHVSRAEYAAKKKADEESYLWDKLIEHFSGHVAEGTLWVGNEWPVSVHEAGLRIMAGESRLQRRLLSEGLAGLLKTVGGSDSMARVGSTTERPDVGYVFLVAGRHPGEGDAEYRQRRIAGLVAYVEVTRYQHPEFHHVVGFSVGPPAQEIDGEELYYLDGTKWTVEQEERAKGLHEELGILSQVTTWRRRASQFLASTTNPRRDANRRKKERQRARRQS